MMDMYILNNINDNLPMFEESLVNYFGKDYYHLIHESLNNTEFVVSRGSGACTIGNTDVYMGSEPICIKEDDKAYIVLPVSFFNDKSCNISFAHLLIHAIVNEFANDNAEAFNETLIDYMANEIGYLLEKNKANISFNKYRVYESNSVYTKLYNLIESYYENNKDDIIECLMGDSENYLDDKGEELAEILQRRLDDLCVPFEKNDRKEIIKK